MDTSQFLGKLEQTVQVVNWNTWPKSRYNDLDQLPLLYKQREVTDYIKLLKLKHWFVNYTPPTKGTINLYNITITLWTWNQQTENSKNPTNKQ